MNKKQIDIESLALGLAWLTMLFLMLLGGLGYLTGW